MLQFSVSDNHRLRDRKNLFQETVSQNNPPLLQRRKELSRSSSVYLDKSFLVKTVSHWVSLFCPQVNHCLYLSRKKSTTVQTITLHFSITLLRWPFTPFFIRHVILSFFLPHCSPFKIPFKFILSNLYSASISIFFIMRLFTDLDQVHADVMGLQFMKR